MADVTGNDILAYQGNAGLGIGGEGIGAPATVDVAPINGALSRLQEHDAQMNVLKYHQRIKEQDDLAKELAATTGSVFNMQDPGTGKNMSFSPLPQDSDVITQGAHDIRKGMLAKPNDYSFDAEHYDRMDKQEQLKRQASLRAIYAAKERLAAQNLPPDERDKALAHMNRELSVPITDFKQPEPYLAEPSFDASKIYDPKDLYETNSHIGKDENGVGYKEDETRPNIAKLDLRNSLVPGSTQAIDAATILRSYFNSPLSKDPTQLQHQNQQIIKANERLGLQPGDEHYIPQLPIDPHSGLLIPNADPKDLYYSIVAPEHAIVSKKRVASDEIFKQEQEQAKRGETLANIAGTNASTAKTIKETQFVGQPKPKELDPQDEADLHSSQVTVNRVRDLFNPTNYQGGGTSTSSDKHQTVDGVDIHKVLLDKGYDPKDWGVFHAPATDMNDLHGAEELSGDTGKEKGTGKNKSSDKVLALKNNKTREIKMAFFEKGDEAGKYDLLSIVSGREAVGNAAKYKHEYKTENGKMADEISRNENLWDSNTQPSSKKMNSFTPKINGAPAQVRNGGSGPEALVNGKWRKIIGKNSSTGEIQTQ